MHVSADSFNNTKEFRSADMTGLWRSKMTAFGLKRSQVDMKQGCSLQIPIIEINLSMAHILECVNNRLKLFNINCHD
jgi:hypothetical protein